jgi:hypothetical protein
MCLTTPAQRRHPQRLCPQRAIADHVMRAGLAHIEQRQAIDRNARFGQVQPQRLRIGARRRDGAGGGQVVKPVEHRAGGKGQPFGRLHPRHPAAFLIDADERPLAPVQRAQFVGQRPHLRAAGDVAAEQDVAGGIGIREEGPLVGGKGKSGKAEDRGSHNRGESQDYARSASAAAVGVWIVRGVNERPGVQMETRKWKRPCEPRSGDPIQSPA